jgi:hypothetical protein
MEDDTQPSLRQNLDASPNSIGELRETSLHASLKQMLSRPGDVLEGAVGRYIIDIVRGEQLIEIQTGSFTHIRRKLDRLLGQYAVTLVYPIAQEKWIVRLDENHSAVSRRKSPRKGRVEDLFFELVRMPKTAVHPGLIVKVLLIQEEVHMVRGDRGGWRRRGWEIQDRLLLQVLDERVFSSADDYMKLLGPAEPEVPFTNAELAEKLNIRPNLAGKMTYTLRKMGLLDVVGKNGRANLLKVVSGS